MARLMSAIDAINDARDINAGFDALVALMMSAKQADAPPLKELGEVIRSRHEKMGATLDEALRSIEA